jgi:hypothetical protein
MGWRIADAASEQSDANLFGQDSGFGSFGLFRPWMLTDGLVFVDGQVTIDHFANAGGNFGAGRRWYHPRQDYIFGLHTLFDVETGAPMGFSSSSLVRAICRGEAHCPRNSIAACRRAWPP